MKLPADPPSESSDDSDDELEPDEEPESELDELDVLEEDDFSSKVFLLVFLFLFKFGW